MSDDAPATPPVPQTVPVPPVSAAPPAPAPGAPAPVYAQPAPVAPAPSFQQAPQYQPPAPAPVAPTPAAMPQHRPEPSQVDDGGDDPELDLSKLPRRVRSYIKDLREEAAGYRSRHKEARGASDSLINRIAEATGVDRAQITPEGVGELLAVHDYEARSMRLERAAAREAYRHGADPDALLDSRSFADQLEKLDPFAEDFAIKLGDLVRTSAESNPRLALQGQVPAATEGSPVAPPPPRSGAEIPGGSGGSVAAITEDQLNEMSSEEIDKAFREGKLSHLL